jgi:cytochrome c oxidase subunit 2
MLAMCLVMAAVCGVLAYLFLRADFIPEPASAERKILDDFIQIVFAVMGIVFGIVLTVFGYALLFFRRKPGDDRDARGIQGNRVLELTWTIIPLIIVVILAAYGGEVLDEMTAVHPEYEGAQSIYSLGAFAPGDIAPPDTAGKQLVVDVTASRFLWMFAYPDHSIDSTYELVVPVNRRVVLRIHSEDVIHSFWVQQWGPKQDAVPGLSPVLRVTPTEIGRYEVECSQLCGFGHTDMTAPARVVSEEDFEAWVRDQSSSTASSSPQENSQVLIDLSAEGIAFDKRVITVPAGVLVQINFKNEDKSVPHNFSVYESSAAKEAIFVGEIIEGPKRITYSFKAPDAPGDYFFRCDVHPKTMTGTFTVK